MALELNKNKAEEIAGYIAGWYKKAKDDRKNIETQAMKNLRQYRGVYDPEVKEKIEDLGRSQVYPRDTRTKVKGFVAKMMEMMYPAEGKNWTIKNTVIPNLPKTDLDSVIVSLEQQVAQAKAQGQELDVTSEMIENAVFVLAKQRAESLEKECEDQLSEMPISDSELSKIALRSGSIYGIGYTKGPMVVQKSIRVWERDEITGIWGAVNKTIPRPLYQPASFWDIYPDLAAKTWADQDRIFEKLTFSQGGLRKLSKMSGVDDIALKKYIKDNREGNYTNESFQAELDALNNTQNVADKSKRVFEVISFRGFLTATDMEELGVKVYKEDLAGAVLVEIWTLGNSIIKLDHTPFGDVPADFYHAYTHGEDEDSGLIGIGLPEDIRDSQLSLCATARMVQDNAAAVSGPIWEINDDLLANGVDGANIASFTVIHREGMGQEAQSRAVHQLTTESHIPELLNLVKQHRETMDIESNLPAWMFGSAQPLGEAFRTTSNMSMMQGGATMVTKDHVRAFDSYVRAKIGSLIAWNKKFNKKPGVEGDFEAQPIGSKSLVAKELRGAALDQFWLSLNDRERQMFDEYGVLKDRLESRDIPVDRLKPRSQAEAAVKQFEDAAAAAAQAEAGLTQAKTEDLAADAENTRANTQVTIAKTPSEIQSAEAITAKDLAGAKSMGDKTKLDAINTVVGSILPAAQSTQQPTEPQKERV